MWQLWYLKKKVCKNKSVFTNVVFSHDFSMQNSVKIHGSGIGINTLGEKPHGENQVIEWQKKSQGPRWRCVITLPYLTLGGSAQFSPADWYQISEEERRPLVFSLSAWGSIRVVLRLFCFSEVAIELARVVTGASRNALRGECLHLRLQRENMTARQFPHWHLSRTYIDFTQRWNVTKKHLPGHFTVNILRALCFSSVFLFSAYWYLHFYILEANIFMNINYIYYIFLQHLFVLL